MHAKSGAANFFPIMVNYGSDGPFWGHGKKSFEHENSGPNSCWNWDVQKVLSRECCDEVNVFLESGKNNDKRHKMIECFVRAANGAYGVCSRQLKAFDLGHGDVESLEKCSQKEFGLAGRNILGTSEAVGKCKPI